LQYSTLKPIFSKIIRLESSRQHLAGRSLAFGLVMAAKPSAVLAKCHNDTFSPSLPPGPKVTAETWLMTDK